MTDAFEKNIKEIETGLNGLEDLSDAYKLVEWHLESGEALHASEDVYIETASYIAQEENPEVAEVLQEVNAEDSEVVEALYELASDSEVPISIQDPTIVSEEDTVNTEEFGPVEYAGLVDKADCMDLGVKWTRDDSNPLESMKEGH